MEFNNLIKKLMEDFRSPFDNKRRVTAPTARNYGTQNSIFNKNQNVAASSGFLGDRLNPKMNTVIFPALKVKKKKIKKR